MQTSEVLNRAADLIEERGWIQGEDGWAASSARRANDPLCLEGGIQAAAGIDRRTPGWSARTMECPAYIAVSSYLDVPRPHRWNDARGRTAPEVIEVLRACAVIEQAREQRAADERMPEAMPEGVLHP